jgi:hypothetical protein
VGANFEMRFHPIAHLRGDFLVKVIGDFPPHFDAADFNGGHRALLDSP